MYSVNLVNKIRKYYKKYNNGVELSLINYEGYNYYIRIDEDSRKHLFYLTYVDLNRMVKFNKNLINKILIPGQVIDLLSSILHRDLIIIKDNEHKKNLIKSDIDLVHFKCDIDYEKLDYTFQTFIPDYLPFLPEVFAVIFNYLPHHLYGLYNELIAVYTNTTENYLYRKTFKFDLMRGKLDKVFNPQVIEKGEEYYKNKNVRFLELINNSYYAVVQSKNDTYTVIIDYNKTTKETRMACNCPCEFKCKHMYATVKQIRNKEFFKYYKVRYIDSNRDYFNNVFSMNYYLCLGIDLDRILLLYPNGEIHSVYLYDSQGNPMFEVVEDSEDNYLTNYIKNNKIKKELD